MPSALQVFDSWLSAAQSAPRPVSPATAEPMRSVWSAWVRFLQARRASTWDLATAEDVDAFLRALPSQPRRASDSAGEVSGVTLYRYSRLLERLYAHAVIYGWLHTANPVSEMHRRERPSWHEEPGAIMPPSLWHALPGFFPYPSGQATSTVSDETLASRDRAILSLLYFLGLAPQEIRDLKVQHIVRQGQALNVVIEGGRKAASRTISVSEIHVEVALTTWLHWRSASPVTTAGDQLFSSRRGGSLSKQVLHNLVSNVVEEACRECALPMPPRVGPQTFRNTAIAQWLASGCTAADVMARAGLADPRALPTGNQIRFAQN